MELITGDWLVGIEDRHCSAISGWQVAGYDTTAVLFSAIHPYRYHLATIAAAEAVVAAKGTNIHLHRSPCMLTPSLTRQKNSRALRESTHYCYCSANSASVTP